MPVNCWADSVVGLQFPRNVRKNSRYVRYIYCVLSPSFPCERGMIDNNMGFSNIFMTCFRPFPTRNHDDISFAWMFLAMARLLIFFSRSGEVIFRVYEEVKSPLDIHPKQLEFTKYRLQE